MIVKLKKFLIYGIKEQMEVFFESSQEKGFVEFIGKTKKVKRYSAVVKDYLDAIKILKKQPVQPAASQKVSSKSLVSRILHLDQALEKLFEEKRLVELDIMRIAPFGDFSKEDLTDLEKHIHRYFQFFTIRRSKKEKVEVPQELIYINSAYDLDYYIAINQERRSYPKMIEIFIDTPLELLRQRKAIVEKQISRMQKDIKQLAGYLPFLMKDVLKEINISSLESVKSEASYEIEESMFVIQAWVPENKLEKLKLLTKNLKVNYEEIAVEKTDKVPTCLENKNNAKIGQDLVTVYDVPSINDKDPSLWVLIFFSIFFATIVGDMGYGIILLVVSIFLKYKFKRPNPVMKRLTKLAFILSFACIIFGALTGSFFGLDPSLRGPLNKVALLNNLAIKKADYHIKRKDKVYHYWIKQFPKVENIQSGKEFLSKIVQTEKNQTIFVALDAFKNNILMEFALFLGVLHISISFLRYLKRNYAGLGWVFFMIGGYLYFPSYLEAASIIHFLNIVNPSVCFFAGKVFLVFGIVFAVCVSLAQKKARGALEITLMVSVFADVMSYLRLYALGLASIIMANTFNSMGLSLGIVFGFIIIIAGHIMNFVLSLMGGTIHGLRLNFIEWYHYSFEGDGKLFDPLRLLK